MGTIIATAPAHNYVALGEMVGALKEVFGTYKEVAVF